MTDRMIDQLDAETVEVLVDQFGKLWVNVDGVCRLRVGRIKHIQATLDSVTIKQWHNRGRNETA